MTRNAAFLLRFYGAFVRCGNNVIIRLGKTSQQQEGALVEGSHKSSGLVLMVQTRQHSTETATPPPHTGRNSPCISGGKQHKIITKVITEAPQNTFPLLMIPHRFHRQPDTE